MPNVNPQAVAFTNNRARPMADAIYGAYLTAKKILAEYSAQNVAAVIPNDATVISDGAAADGRAQVTDAQVINIINRAQELVNWMERATLNASGTQDNATLNTVAAVAVNGQTKF
jgi:hypothetical protein